MKIFFIFLFITINMIVYSQSINVKYFLELSTEITANQFDSLKKTPYYFQKKYTNETTQYFILNPRIKSGKLDSIQMKKLNTVLVENSIQFIDDKPLFLVIWQHTPSSKSDSLSLETIQFIKNHSNNNINRLNKKGIKDYHFLINAESEGFISLKNNIFNEINLDNIFIWNSHVLINKNGEYIVKYGECSYRNFIKENIKNWDKNLLKYNSTIPNY